MVNATHVFKGILRGRRTVELQQDADLPDGAIVDVTVSNSTRLPDALREAFGAAADDPAEVAEFLRHTYSDRESDPRNGATL